MKATAKTLAVKIAAAALSVLMFVTVMATTALHVMAAEPPMVEIQSESALPAMTQEEMQMYVNEYLAELDQNDGSPINPAEQVLKYLAGKVLEKFGDTAVNTAFEAIFGKNGEGAEILNKLNEINGKLDKIIQMLEMVFKQLDIKEVRESINKKNLLYNSIAAQTKSIDGLFKSSMGKENYKELRWAALKDWHKLRLGGNSNSITSMILFCDTITNATRQSWGGNYFSQYKNYATLMWDWDSQRAPFETMQSERDIYIVAQMATYNLMYLQYAEDNGLKMDYTELRRQVGECLDSVLKTYTENKPEVVDPVYSKMTYKGANILMYRRASEPDRFDIAERVSEMFQQGHKIWEMEDYLRDNFKSSLSAGEHILANSERDWLMKVAKEKGVSFKEMIEAGGIKMHPTAFLVTSTNKNAPQVWHYGERHFPGWRDTYIETLDIRGNGQEHRNTRICRVSVDGNDRMEPCNGEANWNSCVYHVDDCWDSEFKHQLRFTQVLYVKSSDMMDNVEAGETASDRNAEGTITNLNEMDGGGQLTVLTNNGETLNMDYGTAEGQTVVDGELANGAAVQVSYENVCYNGETSSNYAYTITVTAEEKTIQGTVVNTDSPSELVLTTEDGQNYRFACDENTEINGELQQGATVQVSYTELPGGMYATQVVVVDAPAPQPAPQPAPEPTPEPTPQPDLDWADSVIADFAEWLGAQ